MAGLNQEMAHVRIVTVVAVLIAIQFAAPLSVRAQAANSGVATTVPGTALPRYEGLIQTDITPLPDTELPTPPGTPASYFRPWPPNWAYKLPNNFWLRSVIQTEQRYDTNVFNTPKAKVSDYALREHPYLQMGWRFTNHFEPYVEYFLIKDVHVKATDFNPPTSQSLAGGAKGAIWASFDPNNKGLRKTLAYDFRFREWWFNSHQRQYDLLPSLIYEQVLQSKSKTNFTKFELRSMLQLDQRKTRTGTTREIDPFFNARILHARGRWLFQGGVTLALDFPTYTGAKPKLKTGALIGTIDISRQVPHIPNLQCFIQGQPIWSFSDKGVPGYTGFNFRLFSGVRMIFDRPPATSAVRRAWKNLRLE